MGMSWFTITSADAGVIVTRAAMANTVAALQSALFTITPPLGEYPPDFSVVLFRPHFMLASEEHLMKMHKNQWLLTMPSPPDLLWRAMNQSTPPGVGGADTFAVT
jgi:hypothetical protein